jgi:hypothetical protein
MFLTNKLLNLIPDKQYFVLIISWSLCFSFTATFVTKFQVLKVFFQSSYGVSLFVFDFQWSQEPYLHPLTQIQVTICANYC